MLGPVIAKVTPGIGEGGGGVILGAEAVSALLMTLLMLKLRFRHPLRAGMLASACFGIPMLLLGPRPELWLLIAASFVAGLGAEVFGVGWSTALHEHGAARAHPGGDPVQDLGLPRARVLCGHPRRHAALRLARHRL